MLAAAAMNLKRMMNIWKEMFLALIYRILEIVTQTFLKPNLFFNNSGMSF
jgi:hypothetical protein